MKNILFISSNHIRKIFSKKIKNESFQSNLIFIEDNNKQKIFSKIHSADALINCPRKYFNKILLTKAKKLKWLHTGGAGAEEYLIPEFVKSNVVFTNGKTLQGPEIADHAVGLLLCITRNLHLHIKGVDKKNIKRPIELKNKICGILGMGGIGFCIAERLKSFGMKIIGISEELIPIVSFVDEFYTSEKLLNILPKLDVLICAAPLTKKTSNLINESCFKKMKKDSIFINVSRGKIVETNALLKNKLYLKFRGVGLDVTNPEPLPKNHKLSKANNIIISNHTSGLSDKNRQRSFELVIQNIKRFLKNRPLLNTVDKIKGY